jgi:ubiquinone/menaquinone biosynthesis C-methylase UbiE
MPVDVNLPKEGIIYQRFQYQKGGIGRWYWDYRDRQILKFIADRTKIVDIGCGEGILVEKLSKKFPEKSILGIDPSTENVDICKAHNLNVCSGSVYELPLDDFFADCVLLIEVIEHLDRPETAIKEINRVLRKNGSLILIFPHDSVFRLARIITCKFKEAFYYAGHVKQWRPYEMIKFLKKNGFEVNVKKNLPFYLWVTSLHCLIVAKKL